jgi:hypothetical protein
MRLCACLPNYAALLLLMAGQLLASMSLVAANGESRLGDRTAPLSDFLSDNPLPDGHPWGDATAFNTNYYSSSPDTGSIPRKTQGHHANLPKASLESTTGRSQGVILHLTGTDDP